MSVAQTGDIVLIAAEVLCRRSVRGKVMRLQPTAADRTLSGICTHLTLYEQNWVLITDQITSSLCMICDAEVKRRDGKGGARRKGRR